MMFKKRPTLPKMSTIMGSSTSTHQCQPLVRQYPETNSPDEKQLTMRRHEALDRLQHDAYPERQQEHAVEETAEELAALPSKGEGLGRRAVL